MAELISLTEHPPREMFRIHPIAAQERISCSLRGAAFKKGGGKMASSAHLVNIILAAFALACEWAVSSITTRGCFEAKEAMPLAAGQNMSTACFDFLSLLSRCRVLSANLNVRLAEICCFCVLSSSYASDGHAWLHERNPYFHLGTDVFHSLYRYPAAHFQGHSLGGIR